jgi:hypothetical protein
MTQPPGFEFDLSDVLKGDGPAGVSPQRPIDRAEVARLFDVPLWVVDGSYKRPRFARLRWRLRRLWPLPY